MSGTDIVNTEQAEAWNGYEGVHWAENRDRYDAMNSGFNEPLLTAAAIGEGDHVLDLGCGNGQITRLAARRAPRGRAVGVDLSAPMLAQARAAAASDAIANVTFEQGDAQVHPFPRNTFDVAVSRFGIMFFADPVAAFTNIGSALRPGGRLAFICLRGADAGEDFARVLRPLYALLGEHAPEDDSGDRQQGPGSFADPDRIHEVLSGAGFTDVTHEAVTAPMVFGRDAADAARFIFAMGPMRYNLRHADPRAVDQAREEVTVNLEPYEGPGGVRLDGSHWLVTASRPRG
ncbi:class I SAM-dependent methyltransferase [Planotetraspora phitsanulokensis]|uniref:Methyltransferase n=1 Tax=Planotetraspora phitsanulokensis TaxID=575192 RepID=A0A8J3XCD5_9ACTN|nr:methyltransferase domain-containing protein [Planotetraspora phitsanulokensis]GII35586.1 methyltransferase [Planotetraspora phitsanulokensis]